MRELFSASMPMMVICGGFSNIIFVVYYLVMLLVAC